MKKYWLTTAFIWFLLAGTLGVILRSTSVIDLPVAYKNLLHSHSHLALLGWMFTAISGLILKLFTDEHSHSSKNLNPQFILFSLSNAGMVISFLVSGYSAISILLSTIHMATAIWFVTDVLKTLKKSIKETSNNHSVRYLKTAIAFMLVSCLGPLTMPVIKLITSNTDIYNNAVYFYLHFQINGWLTFSVIALLLKFLKDKTGEAGTFDKRILPGLFITTILTVSTTFNWSDKPEILSVIETVTVSIQLVLVSWLLISVVRNKTWMHYLKTKDIKGYLIIATLAFFIKNILQIIPELPELHAIFAENRYFIIAFLHLYLIGAISTALLVLLHKQKVIRLNSYNYFMLISSFIITEVLITMKGFTPQGEFNYFADVLLISFSTVMVISLISFLKPIKETELTKADTQTQTQIINNQI